ncbi:hypothetical protein FJT64_023127 [Amphibalanus amphitrite]|uniref:Uncharacterized protein n=1 Tax=Amphibalanus amphitrite TaxID=1232801 RepID=A0A6A4WBQ3_AMPAM|nr:hypothetical protein FJT64_023127 [Amphibalanus amphitrite]
MEDSGIGTIIGSTLNSQLRDMVGDLVKDALAQHLPAALGAAAVADTLPAAAAADAQPAADESQPLTDHTIAGIPATASTGRPPAGALELGRIRHRRTADALIGAALAATTQRAYQRVREQLAAFVVRQTAQPLLPISTLELLDFLGSRYAAGCGSSTLASMVSAVAYDHRVCGLPDPTADFRVKQLLAGARRLRAGRAAGLDASHLTGHCLRISDASHGAAIGLSEVQLRDAGRWSSSAWRRYLRRPVSLLQRTPRCRSSV